MRLKGGKLLLDLSYDELKNFADYPLTSEQINCILSKGLILKVTIDGFTFTFEPSPYEINGENSIIGYRLNDADGGRYDIQLFEDSLAVTYVE